MCEPQLDVAIVHHPTFDKNRPIPIAAMGLISIADHLHRQGLRVQVINLAVEFHLDAAFDLLAYLKATGVKVLGLSVHWFFQLPDSLALARQVKEQLPDLRVVLGGYTASFFAQELLAQHPYLDGVIRGDGEIPFGLYCQRALGRTAGSWSEIPNLIFRDDQGQVLKSPTTHLLTPDQLAELHYANLSLLKNQAASFQVPAYPSQRFKQRFGFAEKGLFILNAGRGCPFACALCGGNREAQKRIADRSTFIFRPVDQVVQTIAEALAQGYENFYLSFDPQPGGDYYHQLFYAIRQEHLFVNLNFDAWGLPSRALIKDLRRTFSDGLIAISADSMDETIRRRTKGQLSFTNAELLDRLDLIEQLKLACQLYLGFFLPGDTMQTVMQTRRMAHDLNRPSREVFYQAFSSDPGSMAYLYPERYDLHFPLRTLDDYLTALAKPRLCSNMLEHRPRDLDETQAQRLMAALKVNELVTKILPQSLKWLDRVAGSKECFHQALEQVLLTIADEILARPEERLLTQVVGRFRKLIPSFARPMMIEVVPNPLIAADELCELEATPYLALEQQFGQLDLYYTLGCERIRLPLDEERQFMDHPDVLHVKCFFRYDVNTLWHQLAQDVEPDLMAEMTGVDFYIDRRGRFIASEPLIEPDFEDGVVVW